MPSGGMSTATSTLSQVEADTAVPRTELEGTYHTAASLPQSATPTHKQSPPVIPSVDSAEVPPSSQAIVPPLQADAAFQAALDQIIGRADVQMRLLDSIHDAMQKELHEMFDRHDNANEAARRLGELIKAKKTKR